MTALYEDAGVLLDDDCITIRRYYFPFATSKRIAYRDIKSIKTEQMGWASGKGRLWGATDPRYWFPLDVKRGSKNTLLILDVGSRVKPCITPEDPDHVIELLKARVSAS
ncbi:MULTISPECIES: hypothetical protein [Mycobacterium]|uniref:Bacterial Pleckstrin homology domain-containing protein n=1 Tax=Mycobacterium persicum TaxID=1487726 RepID=A0A1X0LCR6_9MYCO|nr:MULTISPECIES: hypothetical protein [Mycobacterium]KZS84387.1 hypothetical protein A4G31_18915 [Mycobacterium persicum]ORB52080.1 hypothetical protein BST40_09725 [Mycobacterium persicum]ORB91137.1 hypothetical protein B1T49_19980 [Mycobacterium persicum]ORB96437.1 hypothetical protein B1T44_20230 [Mycobacterium persicum]ORC03134.1 hypothetical protein B1T48_19675 [Mycobacterium persicum]